MSGEALLGFAARIAFLLIGGAVLALNLVGLPANWILFGLALAYGLLTDLHPLGALALGVIAGLAVLGEVLEFLVGLGYTARRGATRYGVVGSFAGGILGALAGGPVVPPFGSLLGALAGSFAGAILAEYLGQRRADQALRAGRAAFAGRLLGGLIKTVCGLWMWCVLAYRLLWPS